MSAPAPQETSRDRLLRAPLGWGVLGFGMPLAIGMVLHTLFNLIDMLMISRLPEAGPALAALGLCDNVAALATIASHGVATAAVAILGRHLGAGFHSGIRRATYQSLWVVVAMSAVFGLLGVFGSDFIARDLMRAKGETAEVAAGYLQVMLGGAYSIFLLLHITSVLRALGHAKTAATLLVSGNALNILLNVFFIYGPGPAPESLSFGPPIAEALGIPRMGVLGAAWATLIARTLPMLLGLFLLVRRRGGPRFHPIYLRPNPAMLRELFRLGWPASAQLVLRILAVLVVIALINARFTTARDQAELTAYSIAFRLESMVLFVGMGWGAAASSFISASVGASDPRRAHRAGMLAATYGALFALCLGLLYLRCGDAFIAFFDDDPAVIAAGARYLGILSPSYVAMGGAVVLSQAIAGAGATRLSLMVDAVVLGVVLPIASMRALFGSDPTDLYTALALGNGVAAVAFIVAYARGGFLDADVRA